MRLAFMGTPDFAVPSLAELIASGHEIVAVYSQPPRPTGRGHAEQKGAVHAFTKALDETGKVTFTVKLAKGQHVLSAAFPATDLVGFSKSANVTVTFAKKRG